MELLENVSEQEVAELEWGISKMTQKISKHERVITAPV